LFGQNLVDTAGIIFLVILQISMFLFFQKFDNFPVPPLLFHELVEDNMLHLYFFMAVREGLGHFVMSHEV
jgi:hypothetical protein